MNQSRQISRNLSFAIAIFTFLCAVYLLSYSGVFHSGDEIYYVQNALNYLNGSTDNPGKGGPFVLALSVVSLAVQLIDHVGAIQALFLLNIPVTAMTACFIFLLGVELGYDRRAAVLVALLFGLTTPAWVYSKALFREPWAAAGLIAALYFAVRFRKNRSFFSLTLAAACSAIAVTTRTTTSVVLPFLLLYTLAAILETRRATPQRRIRRVPLLLFALLLIGLAAANIGLVVDQYRPLAPKLLQVLTYAKALSGILASPGRGLLIYTPVLVMSLVGLYPFYRRHRREALVICGSFVVYVLMLAAYLKWWGGWGWGPRFLLPFLPYLMLPIIAIVQIVLIEKRMLWAGVLLVALGTLGGVIQLTGVVVGPSMPAFNLDDPQLTFDLSSAPLAWRLAVWDPGSLDVAWLHLQGKPAVAISILAPTLLLVALSAGILFYDRRPTHTTRREALLLISALVLCLATSAWSLHQYSRGDLRYTTPDGFREALRYVLDHATEDEILIVVRNKYEPGPYITYYDGSRVQDPHIYRSRVYNECKIDCLPYDEAISDEWLVRPDHLDWPNRIRSRYKSIWVIAVNDGSEETRLVEEAIGASANSVVCQSTSPEVRLCMYSN
ncbi:MAG: hypothetical protein KDH90_26120 [Anaerolineae bacterium]|nr:hypothetical protein [Anaerolineae bacterium]